MRKERIIQAIENKFSQDGEKNKDRKIVFWYDQDNSFADLIDELSIEKVKIIKINKNYFYTKYLLEKKDPDSDYLIYINTPKPRNEDNWLLDILLYSQEFNADMASIIMDELAVTNRAYYQFFRKNIKFFKSQKRIDYIKNAQQKGWNQDDYYIAMLSYICGTKQFDIGAITKNIFKSGLEDHKNQYLSEIKNFNLDEIFWQFAEEAYGYHTEKQNLRGLFLSILITYLISTLKVNIPHDWKQYISKRKNNCMVFIDNWMNHKDDSESYEYLVNDISSDLKINEKISSWPIDAYKDAEAFDVFDKFIINQVIDLLKKNYDDYDYYLDLIKLRKTKHWATSFKDIYNSLSFAIKLLKFKKEHNSEFYKDSPEYLLNIYAQEFYKVDYYYRKFYYIYDRVSNPILEDIQNLVERIYVNWFLDKISPAWLKSIKKKIKNEEDSGWPIKNISQQRNFYDDNILPILDKGAKDKVFVFISDGLRFEIAKELADALNSETRGSTNINYLQGVLPSSTKFGIAALMPNQSIIIGQSGEIKVDQISISTIGNRNKILAKHISNSMAISWNDLNAMTRDEARDTLKNQRLVYIFHNSIDAFAEDVKNEVKIFNAAKNAIEEIKKAVKYICNSLNGTRILIVADHGFLYKRSKIEESEKLKILEGTLIEKSRRYLLSKQEAIQEGVISVNMDYLVSNQEQYYAIIPNGIIRFKTQGGGINYVHGGASLQEIVVPLIDYRHIKKHAAKEKDLNKPARIEVIDSVRKITNNSFKIKFFQVDKVSDKVYPVKLQAAFWDLGETEEKISNVVTFLVDKNSDNADERVISLNFSLKQKKFDKNKDYYLILSYEKTGLEYMKIPYKIDVLIENWFGD